MCTLYKIKASRAELAGLFNASIGTAPETLPSDEVYPKRQAYVVRQEAGTRWLDAMQWGFPPPPAARAPVVNVRNLASPFWRTALAKPERRCIVPVSTFCEWEGEAGAKIKRWFTVLERPVFAFAGIWRPTEAGPAFAFLTCEPCATVAAVHPKAMPVILHDADHHRWLEGHDAAELAAPFPSQLLAMT